MKLLLNWLLNDQEMNDFIASANLDIKFESIVGEKYVEVNDWNMLVRYHR